MRKPLLISNVVLLACLVFSPVACFASVREESIDYAVATLHSIVFWLAIAPEILNLILILVSLYLMLDGVRRWGTNTSGAFSRCLIGLFILHTSSLEISFLPYLALFLEIWLCARNFEARIAEKLKEEQEKLEAEMAQSVHSGEERKRVSRHSTRPLLRDWKVVKPCANKTNAEKMIA